LDIYFDSIGNIITGFPFIAGNFPVIPHLEKIQKNRYVPFYVYELEFEPRVLLL